MNSKAKYNQYTDQNLIDLFKRGDQEAMGALYARYYQKVYYKCLSFTNDPDEAFDLSEDILMKAFDKVGSFKGTSSFSTWLFSITYNECIELTRKTKKYSFSKVDDQFDLADDNEDVEDDVERSRKEAAVLNLLADLPESDREILIMKYMDNAKIGEIQAKLGLSASAVKMRLSRAKEKINKMML
ncbi:MAG: RNA polymerase sigma factor [Flavobacteriales bacterium]|nr:RNA polymerase sigma factor [Flavobacteriales bacterium]